MAKKAAGEGTIRKRSDGRWEAIITVGTDPGTGKAIRRSVYGKTQKEVKDKKLEILAQIKNGEYRPPDKTTVSDWLDLWLTTYVSTHVKPLTLKSYETTIRVHIKPAIGGIKLQSLDDMHITKMYNAMLKNGKSAKTVKNAGAILSQALSKAVQKKIIPANPCDVAELPRVEKKEIAPLRDEEIPPFLGAIDSHPLRNAFALCLFAGLREGECLGLSWDQVDFAKQKITIKQQLQEEKKKGAKYYIAESTKSGKIRVIQPPDIAFKYLRNERAKQAERQLYAGELWNNPHNLVFTNELGRNITFDYFYRQFKKIAASIGRPDARPHDLRHTAATVALSSGADIKSVQGLLGHSTAAFTLDRYGHVTDRMREDTANRVQGYYDSLNIKKA